MISQQRCKEGFAPAVKNKKGEVFLPTKKNQIHADIFERLEPYTKKEILLGKYCDSFFKRMKRKGYIEGFVILRSGKFLDRDQMEKKYKECETVSLRGMYPDGI